MTAAISSPTYPVPGQRCEITFSGLNSATNQITLYPISAPEGSRIRENIEAKSGQRVEEYTGKSSLPWVLTPDVGGRYEFTLEESTIGDPRGRAFDLDTRGSPDPVITQTSTVSFFVGERMAFRLGQYPDQAKLNCYVWDETIRATTLAAHGEDTPALSGGTSPRAGIAILDSDLVAAAAAMANTTVSAFIGVFSDDFDACRNEYDEHVLQVTGFGGIHVNQGDTFVCGAGVTAANVVTAEQGLSTLRNLLVGHASALINADESELHLIYPDGGAEAFQTSGSAGSRADQYTALADIVNRLEEHVGPASFGLWHTDALLPGTVTGLSPLLALCRLYLLALRVEIFSVPDGRNAGAARLEQLAGFEKS